jgi:hypothetical protein
MTCVHEAAVRARRDRRARLAATPAHVVVPTLIAAAAIVAAVLVAHWLGASAIATIVAALVTWVVASIVAHRTVSSVAAGATLRLAAVYTPGERVRIDLPQYGLIDAEIVHVGLANTTLLAGEKLVVVANNRLLTVPRPALSAD